MATKDKIVNLEDLKVVSDYHKTALSDAISGIQTLVGSPLVATAKSEMTNTNKVYVYQRSPAESGMVNGNWYYYDGSAWVSGGVYNAVAVSTDKTLSVTDKAADGKSTGDAIALAKASVYAGEQDVSFTSSSGYIDTSNIGAVWTANITSSASYKYIDSGIDVSSYRTFNGRVRLSVPQIMSNSARFGFADTEDKIVWVTTNKAVKDSYVYNSKTGMYELFIPIFGDKFFYSNSTTVAQPHLMSISLLFDSAIVDEGAFSGQGESGEVGDPRIRYIAPDGDDEKSGLSPETALKTIYQAFKLGAETVICAPGTYTYQYIAPAHVAHRSVKIIGNGAVFDGNSGNNIQFENCDVEISGLTVQNTSGSTGSCFWFKECTGRVSDCSAINTQYMGFRMVDSHMTFIRCYAENAAVDGFNGTTSEDVENNTHGDCDCTFIDCQAFNCGDDGLSLHNHSHFVVIGGEFAGCTSTGIAPHQWCSAEIYGAYVHDNGSNGSSGIEAKNPSYTSGDKARVMTFGNLITNNGGYGIDTQNDILISVGDKFANNVSGTTHRGSGAEVIVY